jgi:hypothetical protein
MRSNALFAFVSSAKKLMALLSVLSGFCARACR